MKAILKKCLCLLLTAGLLASLVPAPDKRTQRW